MNLHASRIHERFESQGVIAGHSGPDPVLTRIAPIEECLPGDLVYVEHAKYLELLKTRNPAAVLTTPAIAKQLEDHAELAVLIAPNVKLAAALIKQAYDDRDFRHTEWPDIHPSAVVHHSARVPDGVVIGPGVVIGADVKLGERVVIMANAVIERGVTIGDDTIIHPACVVSYGCEIGSGVFLKSGCVIGSEGFGFAQDEKRHNYRMPHSGKVVIEDRVIIGANTTVDRATYGATIIRSGVIIDALCHIAHNVEIGEDCIICAHTGISGSSKFGQRVIATGQTGVLDHVSVASDSILLHRAGIHNSIKESGAYAGGPTQPLKEYLKNIAVLPRLAEIWSRLRKLEKRVAQLTGTGD
jgi:UDP-3-O-[3-hydroxymyristoyl] glucosamine N-acyltransferase